MRLQQSTNGSATRRRTGFDQIPGIAVAILEHDDRAVWLDARFATEVHAGRAQACVVGCEVVGVQEEGDASTGLIPDAVSAVARYLARASRRPIVDPGGRTTIQRFVSVRRVSSTSTKPRTPV